VKQINLIQSQSVILKSILSFGGSPTLVTGPIDPTTGKDKSGNASAAAGDSDEETEIEVGDGAFVPRALFTFKALLFDQHT